MLISEQILEDFVAVANISPKDTVLEIGTGKGALTSRLVKVAESVTSYEIDHSMYSEAGKRLTGLSNLKLINGDAFDDESNQKFYDVCITSLPYSESLRFVRWLSCRRNMFNRILAIVQTEFADKLRSMPGLPSYRAVSVVAQLAFDVQDLFPVPRDAFDPPPRVMSEAIRLNPKSLPSSPLFDRKKLLVLDQLFSFRGRKLRAALRKINPGNGSMPQQLLETRIEKLIPQQFSFILQNLGDS